MKIERKGFTLIELLLVIGIIAVLAVVVFVALDPAKRFQDARNARRTTDVQSILSAVHQSIVDNKGALPFNTGLGEMQIGTSGSGCSLSTDSCSASSGGACLDLSSALSKYLKSIPTDPQSGTDAMTHYSISANADGIVTVTACDSEGGETISASR